VAHIIVVDNGSSNIDQIRRLCSKYDNVTLMELGVNLGVEALNVGMSYAAKKFDSDFILLLDDDTTVYPGALSKVLSEACGSKLCKFIGALRMSPDDFGRKRGGKLVAFFKRGMFSGSLIRTQLVREGIRIRKEFFLDQADFDFYDSIRRHGYLTVLYREKLIDHKLGTQLQMKRRPKIRTPHIYEPPWKYYYIVRNSTVLLIEHKLDIETYIIQLITYAMALLLVDGIFKTLKALVLGLTHGLFKKLGYLNPYNVGLFSTLHNDRLYGRTS